MTECGAASEGAWAAAITKPLAEEQAESALRSRGWRAYLPRYRKILRGHRRGARGEIALRPLFPRYVFVELQPQWSGVANVPGIVSLVGGFGDGHWQPYTMPAEVVEAIRAAENAGEWDEARETGKRNDLPLGSLVTVPELGGALGRLLDLDDGGRAKVLIEILGRSTPARVAASGLALADVA